MPPFSHCRYPITPNYPYLPSHPSGTAYPGLPSALLVLFCHIGFTPLTISQTQSKLENKGASWYNRRSFPGGSDGKESACNVGDVGSIPGLGRSPGGGHGRLQSMGSQRVGRDWAAKHSRAINNVGLPMLALTPQNGEVGGYLEAFIQDFTEFFEFWTS